MTVTVRLRDSGHALLVDPNAALARGTASLILPVPGVTNLVAKVFVNPQPDLDGRLDAMLAARPQDPLAGLGRACLAWPQDALVDAEDVVVGYVTTRVEAGRSLDELFDRTGGSEFVPDWSWWHQHRAARTVAMAFAATHSAGHLVGPAEPTRLLWQPDAVVTIIGTERFQISDPIEHSIYRRIGGFPFLVPPELHEPEARHDLLKTSHDAWTLGVLVHLLLLGAHPNQGDASDTRPMAERIRAGGWNKPTSATGRPGSEDVAPSVREMLRRCLEGRDVARRPTAADWVRALGEAEAALTRCEREPQHFHVTNQACPWCPRQQPSGTTGPRGAARAMPSMPPPAPPKTPAPRGNTGERPVPRPVFTSAPAPTNFVERLGEIWKARPLESFGVVAVALVLLAFGTNYLRDRPRSGGGSHAASSRSGSKSRLGNRPLPVMAALLLPGSNGQACIAPFVHVASTQVSDPWYFLVERGRRTGEPLATVIYDDIHSSKPAIPLEWYSDGQVSSFDRCRPIDLQDVAGGCPKLQGLQTSCTIPPGTVTERSHVLVLSDDRPIQPLSPHRPGNAREEAVAAWATDWATKRLDSASGKKPRGSIAWSVVSCDGSADGTTLWIATSSYDATDNFEHLDLLVLREGATGDLAHGHDRCTRRGPKQPGAATDWTPFAAFRCGPTTHVAVWGESDNGKTEVNLIGDYLDRGIGSTFSSTVNACAH